MLLFNIKTLEDLPAKAYFRASDQGQILMKTGKIYHDGKFEAINPFGQTIALENQNIIVVINH